MPASHQIDFFVIDSSKQEGHGPTGMHGTHYDVLQDESHILDYVVGGLVQDLSYYGPNIIWGN